MMIILVLLSFLPETKRVVEYEDIVGDYFGYSDDYSSFFHLEIGTDRTAVLWVFVEGDPLRIPIVFSFHKVYLRGFAKYEGKHYLFKGAANGFNVRFSLKIGEEIQGTLLRADEFRKNLELLCPLVSEPCHGG